MVAAIRKARKPKQQIANIGSAVLLYHRCLNINSYKYIISYLLADVAAVDGGAYMFMLL
jgi:hypothetical protein